MPARGLTKWHDQWILDGSLEQPFDGWGLNLRNFDYVSTFKAFLKVRSSYFWVVYSFWKFVCLAISVHSIVLFEWDTKELLQKNWLLPVKFECFSGKNLKCFVADCRRWHQSKKLPFSVVMSSFNFVFFSL